MADAAARREARRKRILDNSQNRLQLISGKISEDTKPEPVVENNCPTINPASIATETDFFLSDFREPFIPNGSILTEPNLIQAATHYEPAIADFSFPSEVANLWTPQASEPVRETNLWEKLVTNKYDIVLFAFLMQFTFGLFNGNANIFLPLVIYDVTKLLWFPVRRQTGIASTLLVMNGLSPERVQNILSIVNLVRTFLEDASVYLFLTVCLQALFVTFFATS